MEVVAGERRRQTQAGLEEAAVVVEEVGTPCWVGVSLSSCVAMELKG